VISTHWLAHSRKNYVKSALNDRDTKEDTFGNIVSIVYTETAENAETNRD